MCMRISLIGFVYSLPIDEGWPLFDFNSDILIARSCMASSTLNGFFVDERIKGPIGSECSIAVISVMREVLSG